MLALKLTPSDTVATVLEEAGPGDRVEFLVGREKNGESVEAKERIPFGFKICAKRMEKGDVVLKYGVPIGRATRAIEPGELVHVHNIEGCRGRGDLGEEEAK
ncbi:MAG: UxaA family hydrolase [Sutterellaceae bacterium]|nr:UxaA family hydrolase [Sutterellaceae bacterium]MDD7442846.1 UxaA family hydrolase [Sutterellaceae bacterium]MDY2868676.1 UxaA family hydrolase [Mesosutterella sp.]